MRRVILVLLTAGLSAPPEQTDLEKIQGTWALTSITIVGEVNRSVTGRTIKIKDKTLTTFSKERETSRETFALDQSKTPKHIDILSSEASPSFGVYELDGDTLKMCFFRNQKYYKQRPKSFASDSDRRTTVFIYSRR